MRTSCLLRLVLLTLGWGACSTGVQAQNQYAAGDMGSPAPVSEASFGSVLERLQAVEASLAEAKKDEKKKEDEWQDTSKEKWTVKWGGRLQMDYDMYASQNADSWNTRTGPLPANIIGDAPNGFEFRRMRFGVNGEGYGVYYFQQEVDFDPAAGTVQMRDCYFGIHELPLFGDMSFGNYKAPFSLEEMTSDNYITCMERSLTNAFAPQRQVGVASFNKTESELATLAYGVFFDNIDQVTKQRVDDRQGTRFTARGTWLPYYDEPSDGRYLVHTGLGYVYTNDQDRRVQVASRPENHLGPAFCDTGLFNANSYNVLGVEGALVWGSFSLQTEWMATSVNALGGAVNTNPGAGAAFNTVGVAGNKNFYGGYVEASYFLTGESRPYKRANGVFDRVVPNTNFWIVRCAGVGSGAIQLVSRWSYLDLSGTQGYLSGVENDATLGVNWYWNPNLRWMFEYIHTWNKYDNQPTKPENNILGLSGRIDW
jgi:phosphate-selective porin OprO/OprP